jgi:putative flippase GtrA
MRRFLIFNSVGALGLIVQLVTLAQLIGRLQWGYIPATAVAVEAAVIHNFFWHERWTWADRGDPGVLGACRRFLRFNLTNGALSIAGNLVFMKLLMETLPVNYIVANCLAIAACAILNFVISDRFVFKGDDTKLSIEEVS